MAPSRPARGENGKFASIETPAPPSLCLVIPTLNEAAAIEQTLAAARAACPHARILVADGGSTDATVALAQSAGAEVIRCRKGRGHQQNAGAAAWCGERGGPSDMLVFLHADTLLPLGAEDAIQNALCDPAVAGGNFRLAFAPTVFWNRVFARVYNARSQRARHYYGDSVLWVRGDVFRALNGFREGMLMEDWEFVQRLEAYCRQQKKRTVCLPLTVSTSARRFAGKRRLRYVFLWCYLHLLHALGVSGDRLARLYPDTR